MALASDETLKYISKSPSTTLGSIEWITLDQIGGKVPVSGIYRCESCGDEITFNKGDRFPPQNKHQHSNGGKSRMALIVKTESKS